MSKEVKLLTGAIAIPPQLRDSLGGVRGAGPPLEPDEPEELEFYDAIINGEDCDLTDDEIDRAREKAWNQLNQGNV